MAETSTQDQRLIPNLIEPLLLGPGFLRPTSLRRKTLTINSMEGSIAADARRRRTSGASTCWPARPRGQVRHLRPRFRETLFPSATSSSRGCRPPELIQLSSVECAGQSTQHSYDDGNPAEYRPGDVELALPYEFVPSPLQIASHVVHDPSSLQDVRTVFARTWRSGYGMYR
jgi:hypothetical protein